MSNPFSLYWNKNWSFQIVHMEGGIHIEAKGPGIILRAPFLPSDNPLLVADTLVFNEDKHRKSLFNSWKSSSQSQGLRR